MNTMWPIKMTDILFWRRCVPIFVWQNYNLSMKRKKKIQMISYDKIISINIWLILFA